MNAVTTAPNPAQPTLLRKTRRPRSTLHVVAIRIRDALLSLLLVLLVIFFLGTVVGRPEETLAQRDASPEQVQQIRENLGLDAPVAVQLGRYLKGIATGSMGNSVVIARGEPALPLVTAKLPATFKLTLAGILVAALLGVGFGVAAGVKPGSLLDRASSSFATAFVSFPYFWTGMILIIVFAVKLKWVPVLADDRQLASYFLPAITLGIYHGGRLFQLARSATFDELSKSYVTVATAKGLGHRAVVMRHILRNIGVLIATMVGWEYARMWGGTVFLIEFVFAWPGIGRLVTDAAGRHDFHVVEAGVVMAGLFVVFSNLLVDVLYSLIDKRIEVN